MTQLNSVSLRYSDGEFNFWEWCPRECVMLNRSIPLWWEYLCSSNTSLKLYNSLCDIKVRLHQLKSPIVGSQNTNTTTMNRHTEYLIENHQQRPRSLNLLVTCYRLPDFLEEPREFWSWHQHNRHIRQVYSFCYTSIFWHWAHLCLRRTPRFLVLARHLIILSQSPLPTLI